MNPQILIEIPQNYSGTKTDVIVALMQKAGRFRKKETRDRVPECFIQFRVFKVIILLFNLLICLRNNLNFGLKVKKNVNVDDVIRTRYKIDQYSLDKTFTTGAYVEDREVTRRLSLDPGYYVIVPSTFQNDLDWEFLLRIFTEREMKIL